GLGTWNPNLGRAVKLGLAVFGRRLGPRPAALIGGVLGTLPDLDVLYPFDDPVDAFVLHRGPTHSLFLQAALTPLLGEALVRTIAALRSERAIAYLGVYLCFATHALLDALTVYGTRIFWPFWPEPVGVGSIFIIDPLYTVPLLVVIVWAVCLSAWTPRLARALTIALVGSSGYLVWGLVAQQIAEARAGALLERAGIVPERLLATPTPFNSLLWRAIAIDGERYFNVYLPVAGAADQATVYEHPRGPAAACITRIEAADRLNRFSRGFWRTDLEGNTLVVADLRMGLTPSYVFRFAVGTRENGSIVPIRPQRVRGERSAEGDLDWLLAGLLGGAPVRSAEAEALVESVPLPSSTARPASSLC
ncbi:MAG: metal-dependent hydrolase, partial [Geminicoccaceae bacterium]|nr:metal-dependent hydrolase [Geminicoccaceae bacterium]